jgi:restriction system protein
MRLILSQPKSTSIAGEKLGYTSLSEAPYLQEERQKMPIPDYQSCMLPLLQFAKDGNEHPIHEAIEVLAKHFKLTDAELTELLPSGAQFIFANRVGWARTYMKKAGLLEYPKRGQFKITSRGLDVLAQKPERISAVFLRQFPEFQEFQNISRVAQESAHEMDHDERQTPEEQIENAYAEIRTALASELLSKVKTASPGFFERTCQYRKIIEV